MAAHALGGSHRSKFDLDKRTVAFSKKWIGYGQIYLQAAVCCLGIMWRLWDRRIGAGSGYREVAAF